MGPEERHIVLEAAGSAREALSKSLAATALDATVAHLTGNPVVEMMQRFDQRLVAHLMPDYVVQAASWNDTAQRLLASSTTDLVASAHAARIEADSILRRAGFADDLRTRFASAMYDSLEAHWAGLPSYAHNLIATRVLPEMASAQHYLGATDFLSLRATQGTVVADTLEHGLYRTYDLFQIRLATAMSSLPTLDEREASTVARGIELASQTLRWSSRATYHLPVPTPSRRVSLKIDIRLLRLLRELHPGLADAYAGAVIAYNRRDRDWRRHVGISLRELLDNLVKILAPSERVEQWLQERGTPATVSRRRRLQFIRQSKADAEVKYIEAQWDVLDVLAEALNGPTHELRYPNSHALRGFIRSAEGCLLVILESARRTE